MASSSRFKAAKDVALQRRGLGSREVLDVAGAPHGAQPPMWMSLGLQACGSDPSVAELLMLPVLLSVESPLEVCHSALSLLCTLLQTWSMRELALPMSALTSINCVPILSKFVGSRQRCHHAAHDDLHLRHRHGVPGHAEGEEERVEVDVLLEEVVRLSARSHSNQGCRTWGLTAEASSDAKGDGPVRFALGVSDMEGVVCLATGRRWTPCSK